MLDIKQLCVDILSRDDIELKISQNTLFCSYRILVQFLEKSHGTKKILNCKKWNLKVIISFANKNYRYESQSHRNLKYAVIYRAFGLKLRNNDFVAGAPRGHRASNYHLRRILNASLVSWLPFSTTAVMVLQSHAFQIQSNVTISAPIFNKMHSSSFLTMPFSLKFLSPVSTRVANQRTKLEIEIRLGLESLTVKILRQAFCLKFGLVMAWADLLERLVHRESRKTLLGTQAESSRLIHQGTQFGQVLNHLLRYIMLLLFVVEEKVVVFIVVDNADRDVSTAYCQSSLGDEVD